MEEIEVVEQWQEEVPEPAPLVRLFRIHVGCCTSCRRRVQPRHGLQTSDALGAAAVSLGPRAVAILVELNKGLGIAHRKCAVILEQLTGIRVTPGGVAQAVARAGRSAEPTYQAMLDSVADAPVVAPDETGWRVGGQRAWLWAFVSELVTVYRIMPGRGYHDAAEVLGTDFAGVLERDGWAPYRRFVNASHQTCLAHLLRRCHELIEDSVAGQARVPHTLRRILQDALALRDRRDTGQITERGLTRAVRRLERRVDTLMSGHPTHPPNVKLLNHVANERDHLFTFLKVEGVQATNWRAEHALRPAVVTRKVWGGNRTRDGADTQQTLQSLLRTCHQQGADAIAVITELLRSKLLRVAPLQLPALTPRGP